jgi:hypothetical protein
MSLTFKDIQDEVARRGTRDQGGGTFTTAIKNVVNMSLLRTARESYWRSLRRKAQFNTVTSYTTGTGGAAVTHDSTAVAITGATLLTDKVQVGRKIKFQGSGKYFFISQITGETTLVLDQVYDGVDATLQSYEILPQDNYALPPQVSHRMFMWHEAYGYPFKLSYVTDQEFYAHGLYLTIKYIPTHYRMWTENDVLSQPLEPSVVTVSSSVSGDTNIPITVSGTVSGYPDSEIITTNASNGTTAVNGTKLFSDIDRISKGLATTGRITVTSNSANNTLAVLPTGDTTATIQYRKVQFYPLPNMVHPVYVQYYKDPYRLVNDGDIHELGQEFDEAIILLATSKIKHETNMSEGDKFYLLWKDEINSLKKTNVDKIDYYAKLQRPGRTTMGDSMMGPHTYYRQCGAFYGPSSPR